jgi:hypothetical protein
MPATACIRATRSTLTPARHIDDPAPSLHAVARPDLPDSDAS